MKIVFFPKDKGVCGILRCYMPAQAMTEAGLAEAAVIDGRFSSQEVLEHITNTDIFVFQYPASETKFNHIEATKRNGWAKIIVEMDDDPYNVSPFNELGYPSFGVEEIEYEGEPLWVDGRNGFDIARNKANLDRFTGCVAMADLVTTTVEPLAAVFRKHNANVITWPNCLDFHIWRPYRPERKDHTVRIGWHGGASHYEDWHSIAAPIRRIIKKNKAARLIIYGSVFTGTLAGLPKSRLEHIAWCDAKMFPFVLAWADFDIGICPLVDNAFNRAKSPLKWEEYAALAIPTVASNVPPYSDAIEDGKTGFLVSTPKEWTDRLNLLIRDAALREEIGSNAMCAVRERYDIDVRVHDLARAYRALFGESSHGSDRSPTRDADT